MAGQISIPDSIGCVHLSEINRRPHRRHTHSHQAKGDQLLHLTVEGEIQRLYGHRSRFGPSTSACGPGAWIWIVVARHPSQSQSSVAHFYGPISIDADSNFPPISLPPAHTRHGEKSKSFVNQFISVQIALKRKLIESMFNDRLFSWRHRCGSATKKDIRIGSSDSTCRRPNRSRCGAIWFVSLSASSTRPTKFSVRTSYRGGPCLAGCWPRALIRWRRPMPKWPSFTIGSSTTRNVIILWT